MGSFGGTAAVMAEQGDQVGTDTPAKGSTPWDREGWLSARLRELGYTALSWPYLAAITLTVFFILRTDLLTLQAMGGAWLAAFGRREFANYMASRQNHLGKQ